MAGTMNGFSLPNENWQMYIDFKAPENEPI